MKLRIEPFGRNRSNEAASTILVTFVLIVVVGSLLASNNTALASLQRELRLVEHRQLQYSGAIAGTNSGTAAAPNRIPLNHHRPDILKP